MFAQACWFDRRVSPNSHRPLHHALVALGSQQLLGAISLYIAWLIPYGPILRFAFHRPPTSRWQHVPMLQLPVWTSDSTG
jgi:hypothetical protein